MKIGFYEYSLKSEPYWKFIRRQCSQMAIIQRKLWLRATLTMFVPMHSPCWRAGNTRMHMLKTPTDVYPIIAPIQPPPIPPLPSPPITENSTPTATQLTRHAFPKTCVQFTSHQSSRVYILRCFRLVACDTKYTFTSSACTRTTYVVRLCFTLFMSVVRPGEKCNLYLWAWYIAYTFYIRLVWL